MLSDRDALLAAIRANPEEDTPRLMFADWLDNISTFTPTRQGREFVIWAVQGGTLEWWVWAGLAVWTVMLLVLALVLFRRDEGRRYR